MKLLKEIINEEIDDFYTLNPKYRTKIQLKEDIDMAIFENYCGLYDIPYIFFYERLQNLKNRTQKDYEFIGKNQETYDKGQIDILEEILNYNINTIGN